MASLPEETSIISAGLMTGTAPCAEPEAGAGAESCAGSSPADATVLVRRRATAERVRLAGMVVRGRKENREEGRRKGRRRESMVTTGGDDEGPDASARSKDDENDEQTRVAKTKDPMRRGEEDKTR